MVPPGASSDECVAIIEKDLAVFEMGFAVMYGPTRKYEGFYGGVYQLTGM